MSTPANSISASKRSTESREFPRLRGSFIGNGYRWLRNPYALLDAAKAELGLTFEARLPVVGKVLLTGDPGLVEATLRNRQLVGGRGTRVLRPLLGDDSLIILESRAHTARKQLLSPAFLAQSAQHHDQLTVDCCLREIERLPREAPFSVFEAVRRITLQSIIGVLFGPLPSARRRQMTNLINAYMNAFHNPLFLFARPLQRDWGKLSPWGRLLRCRNDLRGFVDAEIRRLRQQSAQPEGLLSSLVGAQRKQGAGISEEAIFNELLGLLLFGHDTSAVTLAWLFYHVYSQPAVLRELRADIAGSSGFHDYLETAKPGYLHCCIQESMRLCPVVVHLTRVADGDTCLGDYPLKNGDKVLPSAYLAQRNPSVFPEPERFRPERFAAGQDYGYSYFPFGFGARKCIGEHLAIRQMQIILYCFASRLELELAPGFRARPERKMLLIGPTGGTMLRVRTG